VSIKVLPLFYSPLGFQKLTISTSAVGFTKPAVTPTVRAVTVTVETNNIRYRIDGSDPDATTGHLLYDGDVLDITNVNSINSFKAIAVGSDATIHITYYGGGGP
jgi:hypothetical protein